MRETAVGLLAKLPPVKYGAPKNVGKDAGVAA